MDLKISRTCWGFYRLQHCVKQLTEKIQTSSGVISEPDEEDELDRVPGAGSGAWVVV